MTKVVQQRGKIKVIKRQKQRMVGVYQKTKDLLIEQRPGLGEQSKQRTGMTESYNDQGKKKRREKKQRKVDLDGKTL